MRCLAMLHVLGWMDMGIIVVAVIITILSAAHFVSKFQSVNHIPGLMGATGRTAHQILTGSALMVGRNTAHSGRVSSIANPITEMAPATPK